jgi:hypothetical protein
MFGRAKEKRWKVIEVLIFAFSGVSTALFTQWLSKDDKPVVTMAPPIVNISPPTVNVTTPPVNVTIQGSEDVKNRKKGEQ